MSWLNPVIPIEGDSGGQIADLPQCRRPDGPDLSPRQEELLSCIDRARGAAATGNLPYRESVRAKPVLDAPEGAG